MISRFRWPVRLGTLLAAMMVWGLAASAQGTLQADLEKQYTLTKMGTDSTGDVVVSAGKVLVLQKGGVLGVPYNNMVFCPSHFQDGNLKPPNTMCKLSVAKVSKYINSGEKVYVTHIEIIPKDEKVIFSIVECDSCNNVQSASQMKSQIVFHYPKGYLEGGADAGKWRTWSGRCWRTTRAQAISNNKLRRRSKTQLQRPLLRQRRQLLRLRCRWG